MNYKSHPPGLSALSTKVESARLLIDPCIYILKNGFYLHFMHLILYYYLQDLYLATIIAFKLYSTNYFYWFGSEFNYLPYKKLNWLKQFVRLTDSGHLASALVAYNINYLPLAFNIHFIIFLGYWIGKLCFSIKDADKLTINGLHDGYIDFCTFFLIML